MRIVLGFLCLVLLTITGVFLLDYLDDRRTPPIIEAADFIKHPPTAAHYQLEHALIFYPGMYWQETKQGRITEIYIPVYASNANPGDRPCVYLKSKLAEDLLLASTLKNLPESAFDNYLAQNRDRLVRQSSLDLRRESIPTLPGANFVAGVPFASNAEGTKKPFPTYPAALAVACAFFMASQCRNPRTDIKLPDGSSQTIVGLDRNKFNQLPALLQSGARMVVYQWCISIVFMSFRRTSEIYFVPPGANRIIPGLHCSFASLLLGWWGIPWGPVWTLHSFWQNFRGGLDVTEAFTPPTQVPPTPPSSPSAT